MTTKPLTQLTEADFDVLRVRNSAGDMTDILSLIGSGGGSGSGFDPTALEQAIADNTAMVNANSAAIATRASTASVTALQNTVDANTVSISSNAADILTKASSADLVSTQADVASNVTAIQDRPTLATVNNLLSERQKILTTFPFGLQLLTNPTGSQDNQLKTISVSDDLVLEDIMQQTVGSDDRRLHISAGSSLARTADLTALDTRVTTNEGIIATRASQSSVANLTNVVDGHTTTLSSHAQLIQSNTNNIGVTNTNLGAVEQTVLQHTQDIAANATSLTQKQPLLSSGGGVGAPVLTSSTIRRIYGTSPIEVDAVTDTVSNTTGIRVSLSSSYSPGNSCYELPELSADGWIRIGYVLTGQGRSFRFTISGASNSQFVDQSITVVFNAMSPSGNVGLDGSEFKGRASGLFVGLGLSVRIKQEDVTGNTFTLFVYAVAGHKALFDIDLSPLDDFTFEGYGTTGIPSDWSTTNSIDCHAREVLTAVETENRLAQKASITQLAAKQDALQVASATTGFSVLLTSTLVRNISANGGLVATAVASTGAGVSDQRINIALDSDASSKLNLLAASGTTLTASGDLDANAYRISSLGSNPWAENRSNYLTLHHPSQEGDWNSGWGARFSNGLTMLNVPQSTGTSRLRIANNDVVYISTAGIQVTGSITATGSITSSSDAALKTECTNVAPEACEAFVRALSVKQYKRIDRGNEHRLGLIAQEVSAICPSEWQASVVGRAFLGVDESNQGGQEIMTLSYERLVCPLIAVTQQLLARVDALEARVAAISPQQ